MQKTNSIVVFIPCKRRFEISILPKYSNNRIIPILLVQLDIGKVMILVTFLQVMLSGIFIMHDQSHNLPFSLFCFRLF